MDIELTTEGRIKTLEENLTTVMAELEVLKVRRELDIEDFWNYVTQYDFDRLVKDFYSFRKGILKERINSGKRLSTYD